MPGGKHSYEYLSIVQRSSKYDSNEAELQLTFGDENWRSAQDYTLTQLVDLMFSPVVGSSCTFLAPYCTQINLLKIFGLLRTDSWRLASSNAYFDNGENAVIKHFYFERRTVIGSEKSIERGSYSILQREKEQIHEECERSSICNVDTGSEKRGSQEVIHSPNAAALVPAASTTKIIESRHVSSAASTAVSQPLPASSIAAPVTESVLDPTSTLTSGPVAVQAVVPMHESANSTHEGYSLTREPVEAIAAVIVRTQRRMSALSPGHEFVSSPSALVLGQDAASPSSIGGALFLWHCASFLSSFSVCVCVCVTLNVIVYS